MTLKNISHTGSSSLFLYFLTVSHHPSPKLSKAWIPPPSCPLWRAPGQSFCHSLVQGLSVFFPHPQPHELLAGQLRKCHALHSGQEAGNMCLFMVLFCSETPWRSLERGGQYLTLGEEAKLSLIRWQQRNDTGCGVGGWMKGLLH